MPTATFPDTYSRRRQRPRRWKSITSAPVRADSVQVSEKKSTVLQRPSGVRGQPSKVATATNRIIVRGGLHPRAATTATACLALLRTSKAWPQPSFVFRPMLGVGRPRSLSGGLGKQKSRVIWQRTYADGHYSGDITGAKPNNDLIVVAALARRKPLGGHDGCTTDRPNSSGGGCRVVYSRRHAYILYSRF